MDSTVPVENSLLSAIGRIGCAGILLDATGSVLATNDMAGRILNGNGRDDAPLRERLKSLLRSGGHRFQLNDENWIMIRRQDRRPLALHAIPIGGPDDAYARTLLIIVDLENHPQPSSLALRRMFGLTSAEAALAILFAQGESPAEIASRKAVSLATVRTQLAAIYAKTQTRRQADLVALLARVTILP